MVIIILMVMSGELMFKLPYESFNGQTQKGQRVVVHLAFSYKHSSEYPMVTNVRDSKWSRTKA